MSYKALGKDAERIAAEKESKNFDTSISEE